ncbi:hypothetical protein [Mycobacterium avium]|uniref:hypothetical protein n=1 Tax=Mycobacterium avium TaxID=1764 RepID=UPI001CDAC429|nr:hypothetical protein [Mycobacterium avium]MCA2261550.1 hypothetical protein [Mycobacterium avium]MCA2291796.1 hypothetical protein [Mycobacterium avium]MCA2364720.1 hypothetical protein [Mycobacterium avium]
MTTTTAQAKRSGSRRRTAKPKHSHRNSNAVSVHQIINPQLATARPSGDHRGGATALAAASPLKSAVVLTAASVIALTPLQASHALPQHLSLPAVSIPTVQLTSVVSQRDIDALVSNLKTSLDGASATVTALAGVPGQTLQSALATAVSLNDSLWQGLTTATANPVLDDVLKALHTVSGGGLTRLAAAIKDADGTIVLTSEQLSDLLTSTLTGSLSTALTAVAGVVNDPLNAAKYIALLNSPLSVAGRVLNQSITAAADLATNGIALGGTFVTAVTAQITNALNGVNNLIDAAKDVFPGNALIGGVLTAVQGIVSAPINVAVAGVNGLTTTVTDAADVVVSRLTNGASSVVSTWLGNGTTDGAVQDAISTIGAAPLSPSSYTAALTTLVGAGITTVATVAHTAGSFASLPFTVGANLTGTGAAMITTFISDAATATSGILRAVGMPALVYSMPKVLAAGVNAAINVAATAVKIGLRTVAGALDLGSTLTGELTPHAAAAAATSTPAVTPKRNSVTLAGTERASKDATDQAEDAEDTAAEAPAAKKSPTSKNAAATALTDPAGSTIADDPQPSATNESTVANESTDPTVTATPAETTDTKTTPAATAPPATRTTSGNTDTSRGDTDAVDKTTNPRRNDTDTRKDTASPRDGRGRETTHTQRAVGTPRHARPDTAEEAASEHTSPVARTHRDTAATSPAHRADPGDAAPHPHGK